MVDDIPRLQPVSSFANGRFEKNHGALVALQLSGDRNRTNR
jgi:hypothetical protein